MNFESGYYYFITFVNFVMFYQKFGVHDFVFMQFHKKTPAELRTGIKI